MIILKMSKDLKILLNEKEEIQSQIIHLNQQLVNLELLKNQNKKEILDCCDHKWVKDNSFLGPYEKPDLICNICGSIEYRW